MTLPWPLSALGDEVEDPETETFLLFAQSRPSQDLGYVDKKETILELSVAGQDFSIQQSPTLLSSDRPGGTTGAVLWKITPLFAEWLLSSPLMSTLDTNSTVLELGCGISALLGLLIGPKVAQYIATDQEYVFKLLTANVEKNIRSSNGTPRRRTKRKQDTVLPSSKKDFLSLVALDWETSVVFDLSRTISSNCGIDLVIACDCIYNECLINPFVKTIADICRLRPIDLDRPTVCIIAQQLRSNDVFDEWLLAFHKEFRVWRISDELLSTELKGGSGFCVHVGILREALF